MLPPGCIIVDKETFIYYDAQKVNSSKSMKDGHYHNYHEIFYLRSGKCDYLIENKIYSLKEHGLILIPSGIIHKTNYTTQAHERILVNFSDDYIDSVFSENAKSTWFHNIKNDKSVKHIEGILNKLGNEYYSQTEISAKIIQCYVTELMAYIVRNPHNVSNSSAENTPEPIRYAMDYISENFASDITLQDIASKLNYSKDYFSKLFKKTTGMGFKAYLLLTRLSAAEKLLLSTSLPIHKIAASCGFNDSNHFSTAFKNHYNISPRNIRYYH